MYKDLAEVYGKYGIDEEDYAFMKMMTDWKVDNCVSIIPDMTFKKIMEIGCASGLMLKEFDRLLKPEVCIGIDISAGSIEMAQAEFPKGQYVITDGKQIPFGDNDIDLVIASDIIEHFDNPAEGLKEMVRVSKYILFKIPLEKSLKTINDDYGPEHPSGHYFKWNRRDALKFLRNSGLEVIDFKVAHPPENIKFHKERYIRYPFRRGFIFVEKTMSRHFARLYPFFYGSDLFAFCKCK